ncbi:MAG: pyridoxamine 5'-phosphate oxidase family protein [Pseudomonadota bacterium]
MSDFASSGLEEIGRSCLDALSRAALDKRSPHRWPVLITGGMDGGGQGRIVVLRRFDRVRRQAEIWTDRRSAKVAELTKQPKATLLFFDKSKMIQMRAMGTVEIVISGDTWETRLEQAGRAGLDDYTTTLAPGSPLGDGEITRQISLERETFTLVRVSIDQLDWLHLSRDGHRRALLDWRSGAEHMWQVP